MHDDRDVAALFAEGLEPMMAAAPPVPEWESLQFESVSRPDGLGQWWMAAVAAVVVIVVGVGSVLLAGRLGGGDDASAGRGPDGQSDVGDGVDSIEGRWVLESWEENRERIMVEVGVNTVSEPWIEFTETFEGTRDSFVSADDTGTAGTFVGSTGCNGIRETGYEYSAGFLVLEEAFVQAVGCEPARAEEVLLAMLWNTSDGIEVVMDEDRMEWFGSNVEGVVYPLVFRRDGSPPSNGDNRSAATAVPGVDAPSVQVYEVDGIEVVTPTRLEQHPERATRVEFITTVIDSGNGPELCIGGVDDSLPPQCSGPVANGLDMDGWSENLNGVRWGDRSVVVTWPPIDGRVEVIANSEAVFWEVDYPPEQLPAECVGVETEAGAGPINEYARSLGGRNGGLYIAKDGTLVLQVVGDPTPHREALEEFGGACVVGVPRSEAEQRIIQDTLTPLLTEVPELAGVYATGSGAGGRVVVHVPVADQATARSIANLVDDPTAIRIVGIAILDA